MKPLRLLLPILALTGLQCLNVDDPNPEAAFAIAIEGNKVSFANFSDGDSYLWDFGNGQTSTEKDPDPVVYDALGTYTITLVVTKGNKSSEAFRPAFIRWKQRAGYPGVGMHDAVFFQVGEKGFYGLGRDTNRVRQSEFWKFDIADDSWSPLQPYTLPSGHFLVPKTTAVLDDRSLTLVTDGPDRYLLQFDLSSETWTALPQLSADGVSFDSLQFRTGHVLDGIYYLHADNTLTPDRYHWLAWDPSDNSLSIAHTFDCAPHFDGYQMPAVRGEEVLQIGARATLALNPLLGSCGLISGFNNGQTIGDFGWKFLSDNQILIFGGLAGTSDDNGEPIAYGSVYSQIAAEYFLDDGAVALRLELLPFNNGGFAFFNADESVIMVGGVKAGYLDQVWEYFY